jgi:ribonuclease-3
LEDRIGFVFKNKDLLRQALTHKSYSNENPSHGGSNNERLEFFGDAVLSLVISQSLLLRNPTLSEGDLSKRRAHVVQESALAEVARGIGLDDYLFLGVGEEKSGGREKPTLLGDAFEALIAAIYLDSGIRAAKKFILKQFSDLDLIPTPSASFVTQDYKTALQELCQQRFSSLPEYQTINESGPGHQKHFEVEVRILGESVGIGMGKSKKEAEQRSARAALDRLPPSVD